MNTSELRKNLQSESGYLKWQELENYFARGVLRVINKQQSLIDMAVDIAQNKTEKITSALDSLQVAEPTITQAKLWHQHDSNFLCVVVAPFVLIQESNYEINSSEESDIKPLKT